MFAARQLQGQEPKLMVSTHSTARSRAAIFRYVRARKAVGIARAATHSIPKRRRRHTLSRTHAHESSFHPSEPRRARTASSEGRAYLYGLDEDDGRGGALPDRLRTPRRNVDEARVKERRRWRAGEAER